MIAAESSGRNAAKTPEFGGEVERFRVAESECDLLDRQSGLKQQLFCLLHPLFQTVMAGSHSEMLLEFPVQRRQREAEASGDIGYSQRFGGGFGEKVADGCEVLRYQAGVMSVGEKLQQLETDSAVDLPASRILKIFMDQWLQAVEDFPDPVAVAQLKNINLIEMQMFEQRGESAAVQNEGHEAGRFPRLKVIIVIAVAVQETEIAFLGDEGTFSAPEPQLSFHDVFDREKGLVDSPDVAELIPQHNGAECGVECRAGIGGEVFPVFFDPFVLAAGVDDVAPAVVPFDGNFLIQKR